MRPLRVRVGHFTRRTGSLRSYLLRLCAANANRGRKMTRILHVEDNEDTRTLVAFLLQAEGWDVVSVDGREVALKHAVDGGFDLYLIDQWIDGNTGNTLCSDLRTIDQTTPILFYSGAMLDDETVRASGAQGFLEKPCSPEALIGEIFKLTRK